MHIYPSSKINLTFPTSDHVDDEILKNVLVMVIVSLLPRSEFNLQPYKRKMVYMDKIMLQ